MRDGVFGDPELQGIRELTAKIEPLPGWFPFTGEPMQCDLCPRQEKSEPRRESNWRCIELDGHRFYICPCHFPTDVSSQDEFAKAYKGVLAQLIKKK